MKQQEIISATTEYFSNGFSVVFLELYVKA